MGARCGWAALPCRPLLLAALLAAWTLLVRAPFLGGPNFTPDAAEYAGMARRLAEGKGFTTALKWHFLDNGPVVRPAVVERPPLYPLFGGVVCRTFPRTDPLRALQTANAFLSALTAALAFFAYQQVAPPGAALAAAFLLAVLPPVVQTSSTALSEALFLLLWMAALFLLPRAHGPGGAALYGFAAGLAALTRPHGALLLLPLLARAAFRRPGALAAGAAAAGVFALTLAPWV
ncbi:MAG: glycosyltransferase family 39 protein, partial [Armatimonadota bacterium]|nr:glycosyltransferase family 39 protein [Armatimonadota bacterium]